MYKLYQKTASGGWYDIILTCQHENEAVQVVEKLIGPHPHTFRDGKSLSYFAHHNINEKADFIIVKE